MSKYSAMVEGGVAVQVIVGDVNWASIAFGGEWHDVDGLSVGVGWTLNDGEWRRPAPAPSWTWEDGAWTPPVPYPDDDGYYTWDEDAQEWKPAPSE